MLKCNTSPQIKAIIGNMLKFNPLKFLVTFNPPYSELLVLIIYTGTHMYTHTDTQTHTHTDTHTQTHTDANYTHTHTHIHTHRVITTLL